MIRKIQTSSVFSEKQHKNITEPFCKKDNREFLKESGQIIKRKPSRKTAVLCWLDKYKDLKGHHV